MFPGSWAFRHIYFSTMVPFLYNDKDLIAADKPEGIAVIPERSGPQGISLVEILSKQHSTQLFVVHRLDKEVSGVILFAKNAFTHRNLCLQFEHREVQKTYTALVHGIVKADVGTIDTPIRQFGSGRMGVDRENGKESSTGYKVIDRYTTYTLLSVTPHTGRRHQIRVHLYSIGHPIAGDRRYGDRKMQEEYPRLMLHASSIEFKLQDGESLAIESPLPESFTAILDKIKNRI